jgi:hypothetical protein
MRNPSSGAGALGPACRDKPVMPEPAMRDGRMPDGRPKLASATDRAEMAAMASTTMPGNVSAQRGVLQKPRRGRALPTVYSQSTLDRNARVRARWGLLSTSRGRPASPTAPSSMKTRVSPTSRANPISW